MKRNLLHVFILLLSIVSIKSYGQCGNSGTLIPGDLTPPGVGLSTSQSYAAGQYVAAFVAAGANYTVSTCGSSSYDTQLMVYDETSGALLAYNDDYCGLQSTVNFTATTCGWVRVILMQYYCNASGLVAPVTMTQNSAGTSSLTLTSAPDVSICSGLNGSIGVANPASGGASPYSYSWSGTAALDSTTSATSTFNLTADASYVLTVTDSLGCSVKDTVDVTVFSLPVVNLGADSTQCGGSILLDAGNTGSSYSWNDASTAQTLSANSSGTYYVTVTDANSCVSTDTIALTIHSLPVVNLGADTAQCTGTILLDAGNAGATYVWNDASSAQTLSAAVSGNYFVTVTDGNGCTESDTINVAIYPNPVVNLGSDSTQCGGSISLDAGNVGASYLWNDASTAQTIAASSSGNYSVTVTDVNGCSSSDTVNITIHAIPVVNLGSDSTQCGGSIVLDAGNAGATYLWSDASTSQTLSVSASGTYSVTVNDVNGCVAADTTVITINPIPSVTLTAFPTPVCLQAAAFNLTGGSPAGGIYSGAGISVSPSFDPAVAGVGSIPVTYTYTDVPTGCSNSAVQNITIQNCTGIEENNSLNGVTLYPNPTTGMFSIALGNMSSGDLVIMITDIQGREIVNTVDKNISPAYTKQIDLNGLSKGIYMVKLSLAGQQTIKKLIVE